MANKYDKILGEYREADTTTPSGNDTELQYNNAGSFGGTTGMSFDGTGLKTIRVIAPDTQEIKFAASNNNWLASLGGIMGQFKFQGINGGKGIFDFESITASTEKTFTFPNRNLTLDNLTTDTTTNLTGLLKGNGSILSTATADTDYQLPYWSRTGTFLYPKTLTDYIGIGTTTPSHPLTVVGDSYISGNLGIGMAPTNKLDVAGSIAVSNNSGFGWGGRTTRIDGSDYLATDFISFIVNNESAMYINSSGKVGIGTNTPTYKLAIYGTAAADGIQTYMGLEITPVSNPGAFDTAVSAGGSVDIDTWRYYVTFYTVFGETVAIAETAPYTSVTAGNQTVTITLPTSTDSRVVGRKVYRRSESTTLQYLVATISNNIDVSYVDTTAKASLTTASIYFRDNTTTNYISIGGTKAMHLGIFNLAINPNGALTQLTSGGRNTVFGSYAGGAIRAGTNNDVFGYATAQSLNDGIGNVFLGSQIAQGITTGSNNVAVGPNALAYGNRSYETFFGYRAGAGNASAPPTGTYNAGVGFDTQRLLSSGSYNNSLGMQSLYNTSSGGYNLGLGSNAGFTNTTGVSNLFIGANAGYSNSGGGSNVFLGHAAGYSSTGHRNVMLGYAAGYYETGNDKLFIDNRTRSSEADGRVKSLIYGLFDATALNQQITFNVGTVNILDGGNIATGTTTGLKIGTSTSQKLGFYNATPIVQPTALTTQLTTLTSTAPSTPDYAIADPTQTTPYGYTTADEFLTTMSVIANLQTRVGELETKLKALGLVA